MQAIVHLIKALFLSFFQALGPLVKVIRAACRRMRRRPKDPREARKARTRCVPIKDPAFVRPDPLIYDQYDLMSRGYNVTWDNPDFALFKTNGTPVAAHDLVEGTEYEVVVRVWNNSVDCPVVMMPVHLSYLSFGVGTVSHAIDTKKVDIGVKGTATNPAFLSFLWRTPPTPGHYCLQAHLDPVADLNFGNNLGQHNTNVAAAHSPATFAFPLHNNTAQRHTYKFRVDAYELGPLGPCTGRPEDKKKQDAANRGAFPLPPGWGVVIAPDNPTLAPLDVVPIQVTVTPPTGFIGTQTVNVHTFIVDDGTARPVGGVTVKVTAS